MQCVWVFQLDGRMFHERKTFKQHWKDFKKFQRADEDAYQVNAITSEARIELKQ